MKQQPKIAELLKRIETSKQQDIELGSYEIYLFSESELEKGQVGYRYDKHKNSLISEGNGKWQEGWIGIGYETDMGDPVFVNVDDDVYPVYTAERGTETWQPVYIGSMDEIIQQL
ncbi:thiamine transporter [Bacillus cereus]|uniref:thiamine transporter n=1 Tax=Bacillus nitratireducens TaxID=2026193 RepID=UPI000BECDD14|nr:thiamine transporter [Bacillus cereus]PEQ32406.1 thiamine transporter [Bacillus cereus]PEX91023.1 thiamine transporter [Bacillus cereus]PFK26232.1 thiamine transporter [Bacillus cereus]PFP56832.1 thiamine transporter [Bacillus cereus]